MAPQSWFEVIGVPEPTRPVPISITRHRRRMARIAARPDVVFDLERAERVVRFIEGNLMLTGDWSGQPFTLMDWQKWDLLYPIFGLVYRDTGLRVIREVYAQLPRGSGKTQLNAGIILYMLLFEGCGKKMFCVGSTNATAKGAFTDCCDIFFSSPKLKPYMDHKGKEFPTELYTMRRPRNTLQVISSDNRYDGPRPAFVSFDEFHRANANNQLHEIFRQSITKLLEGLMITITNAGEQLTTPCYQEYQRAGKLLAGELQDDAVLAYIPEPDPTDRWDALETALKVNLSLGHTVHVADLERELNAAIAVPSKKSTYIRYRLNTWYLGTAAQWIPFEKWEAVQAVYTLNDLAGSKIWLGVDKASRRDLSSISGVIQPPDGGPLHIVSWNFRPDSRLVNISGEAPYGDWHDQGYIESGGSEDYILDGALMDRIEKIAMAFDLQGIGFDRAMAGDLMIACDAAGWATFEIPQGRMVFTEPINKFEELVLTQGIRAPMDPCLAWQFSNTLIDVDQNGLKRFVKEHKASNKRNDAIVAITQAIYIWQKMTNAEDDDGYCADQDSFYRGLSLAGAGARLNPMAA